MAEMPVKAAQPGKLNLGCGPGEQPTGWLNVDGSWNAKFAKYHHLRKLLARLRVVYRDNLQPSWDPRVVVHDLRKPLSFHDSSFSAIYASHILEHLYLVEAQALLAECKRVLRPGGVLRLVVPDLRSIVVQYINKKTDGTTSASDRITAADILNQKLHLRTPAPPTGSFPYRLYTTWKDFHSHKWMYDADSLVNYLEMNGFIEVSEKGFCESRISGIEEVEQADRVLAGAGICVEGTKPK